MNVLKKTVALILAAAVLLLTGCSGKDEVETFHGVVFPVSVYSDIVVEDGFPYTGVFPEDGSFAEKENVFALKVANRSDKDLQLVRIYVTTTEKEMFFEITTLPANTRVTVLEKAARTLEEGEEITGFRAENRVDFESGLNLHRETFSLAAPGGVFNIKNIGSTDISSDIFVYYKKRGSDGDYFGGITFRSRAKGLKSGELKQLPATHFDPKDSEVVFIDYQGE